MSALSTSSASIASLPTEYRPLLFRTTTNHIDDEGYSSDERHETVQQRQQLSKRKKTVTIINNNTSTISTCTTSSSYASISTKSNTDWLSIARHTLQDVTSSLPVARNNELRLKTTSATITKIEQARQLEQEPSLHAERYKLPGKENNMMNLASDHYLGGGQNQTVYEEAVRVRNTLEIVASRIRDAIATDVRNRLYNKQKELHLREQSKKVEQQQAEQIHVLQSDLKNLVEENGVLKDELDSAHRQAEHERRNRDEASKLRERNLESHRDDLHRQVNDANRRNNFYNLVESVESEHRHVIEIEFLEGLLVFVLEQHQSMYNLEKSKEQSTHQHHNENAKREQEQRLHQQEKDFADRTFIDALNNLCANESETRNTISDLAFSEFDFLLVFCSEETETVIERTIERDRLISDLREDERTRFETQLQHETTRTTQIVTETMISNQLQQLQDVFEPSARELFSGWERDQIASILDKCRSEMESFSSFASASTESTLRHQRAVGDTTCRSKYFHIWSCWALFKREENYRLDRERHRRIVESAMLLQQSQMESALTPLMTTTTSMMMMMSGFDESHHDKMPWSAMATKREADNQNNDDDEHRRRALFDEDDYFEDDKRRETTSLSPTPKNSHQRQSVSPAVRRVIQK